MEIVVCEKKPVETAKPLAVIDKGLLQGICELPPQKTAECFEILQTKVEPVVTLILIEETLVSYFESQPSGKLVYRKMLEVIHELRGCWMEEPLELIFREFILKQDIWLNLGMNAAMEQVLFDIAQNPDSLSMEASQWIATRRQEKQERLEARLEFQKWAKTNYGRTEFQSLSDFMEYCIMKLCVKVDNSPEIKMRRLNAHLGRDLKRRHVEHADLIEKEFSEATFDSLDKTRLTRNYLLAEIVYDLGVISSYTNPMGQLTNVLPRKRGKQINDEDDQQYVVAALACPRLLTCDAGMHRVASLFSERGIWTGKSILIPRNAVYDLAKHIG